MRLLECHNSGEFTLTGDFIKDIPRYAILSHTWGADTEEVSFTDLVKGVSNSKAGFEKIRFCGAQALRDGLRYFWVDTCCIDKSNNTELAEAINSMFQWYRNATKCYVYLPDVSISTSPAVQQSRQMPWKLAFRKSRWFTRGWTLQELIAPQIVEFFSRERHLLGDKKSLEHEICQITGIAVAALRGTTPLQSFSFDERMSWAKTRQTTRSEDAAYCLLGIFDVHMPLIYGEGRERALNRLRKETQETHSLPTDSLTNIRTGSLVVMTENRPLKVFTSSFNDAPVDLLSVHFIERKRELDLIKNAYQVCEGRPSARCAIWGIPGVGKTQLAIRYTKIFLEDEAVSAVFWISCSNEEKLHQGFSNLLNLIDHPEQFRREQSARIVAARRWLEQPEVSGVLRWLLVLDNVQIHTLELLREYLPRSGTNGRILITTRTEAVAHTVCKASGRLQRSFELDLPTIEDAVAFFLQSVGAPEGSITKVSRCQVTALIQGLGRLPFAVEHAASFMTQSLQSVDSFTRLYNSNQKPELFDWRNLFAAYEAQSISDMFLTNLDELRRSGSEALHLLNILAFLDPDTIEFETIRCGALSLRSEMEPAVEPSKPQDNHLWKRSLTLNLSSIPFLGYAFGNTSYATDSSDLKTRENTSLSCEIESIFTLASSEVRLHGALQQLQMNSFIKRRSAQNGGVYCMHDLTQTWVQMALESEKSYLPWLRCAITVVCGAFRRIEEPASPDAWSRYEGLIPHFLSLTKYSELMGLMHADLLTARTNIAAYWCKRGRYHEAREAYQRLLDMDNSALYDADSQRTQWKLGLAEVNWHLGKLDESISLYSEVRHVRESRLGADHPDVLHVSERMALVYRSQARYTEARQMLEHVLERRKSSLGPDHLVTVRTIDNLAMVINEYAESYGEGYDEAESLHKQALACREAQLGQDHLDTLWSAENLATNYRAQGRYLEAVEIHERVLAGRKVQLGEDHPDTMFTLANVASACTNLGHLREAEVLWKQTIVGNEQRRGHNHSGTLFAVEGLADVFLKQSRFEEAISLYHRALRASEDNLGEVHPSVLRRMHKLANLYRDQTDFTRSIALFERLLERRSTGLRPGHPTMLQTNHDAATSYINLGRYTEAEKCYRRELAGSVEEFGSLHSETQRREQKLLAFLADRARNFESESRTAGVEGSASASKHGPRERYEQ